VRFEHCHNLEDLGRLARRRLPRPVWDYLEGGADDEVTAGRNCAAFDRYELRPQALVDVERIDTSVEVLGARIDWPAVLAPAGMSRLFHTAGELAAARSARRNGTLCCLSTLATTSIEDVGAASDGPKCFQVYVLRDRGLTREYLERCRAAGFGSLCLTVDVPVAGNRERDRRNGMTLPPRLTARRLLEFLRCPAWCRDFLISKRIEFANIGQRSTTEQRAAGGVVQYLDKQFDRRVTWQDAAWLAREWGGPLAIKGILNANDAQRCVDSGATAVVVSNHGGRQLDGVPAPIDALEEIVDAVGGRAEIILDGGVRRGTHVVKALALGATACMIGRGYLYGLAAGGEAGVDRALSLLRSEIERDLALLGCASVRELGRTHVSPRVTSVR
jgi:L-lactate dehydrogenase (cytochrome)